MYQFMKACHGLPRKIHAHKNILKCKRMLVFVLPSSLLSLIVNCDMIMSCIVPQVYSGAARLCKVPGTADWKLHMSQQGGGDDW